MVEKVFDGLKSIDEGGPMVQPSAAKSEQVDHLLKETKELVEQLKAERGKAKKAESR